MKAVVTGADLAEKGLAWMPTLSNDVQAVLATDKVRFQGQEVAFVVAEDRYSARDALELIDVEYDILAPVIDVRQALAPDAPVIRDDLEGKTDNHCFDWETGDEEATEAVFAKADVVVTQDIVYPRVHPAPMETCGCVADYERVGGQLTLWTTSQAPHAHRTVYALVSGLPEHKIRVIAPDIGGGFGNKVPIYPGYVCAIVGLARHRQAGEVDGGPHREPGQHRFRARLRHAWRDRGDEGGQDPRHPHQRARRPRRLQRHRGADQVPRRLLRRLHRQLRPRGRLLQDDRGLHEQGTRGVAYACSFRITEAVYLVERIVDCLAYELDMDPVALRLKNFIQPDQFPYTSKTGWVYDSGEYETAMRLALEMAGYDELRREQEEKRARGELMGIGVAFFTEAVGAGPRKDMDIPGLGMADGCELRVHPTGKAVVRRVVHEPGPGPRDDVRADRRRGDRHPAGDIHVVHGDTDKTPFGLGTYGSRSTPVSGAAAAMVARKVRDKAQIIASGMLEVSAADLDWEKGSFHVKGVPSRSVTIQDIAMRAHGAGDLPDGIEGGLEAQICYNPENLTYPFGAYICVVDVDPGRQR